MVQSFIDGILGSSSASDSDDQTADRLIEKCGYAAAAITILPIPGSEIVAVMPIHVGMVIGIGSVYGCQVSQSSAIKLVTEILTTAGVSLVGSRLAITTAKVLLPGFGGLIGAPLIFAATIAIGRVSKSYFKNEGNLDRNEIRSIYEDSVRKARQDFDKSKMNADDAQNMARAAAENSGEEAVAANSEPSPTERLAKLKDLLDKGLIEPEEYNATKQRILSEL